MALVIMGYEVAWKGLVIAIALFWLIYTLIDYAETRNKGEEEWEE